MLEMVSRIEETFIVSRTAHPAVKEFARLVQVAVLV